MTGNGSQTMDVHNHSRGELDHIREWVFDLDNTLYPRTCDLFAQVDSLITRYVMKTTGLEHDRARRLQKDYYRDHGTTLNGLMLHHDVDPEDYLNTVHAIDYSPVQPDPELVERIGNLPGRKYVFTNADQGHARAVLDRLGATDLFESVFGIRETSFVPKPEQFAFESFLDFHKIEAERAAMFDDLEKNLFVPHLMGMATIQVVADEAYCHDQVEAWELGRATEGTRHIHHVTDNLKVFLGSIGPLFSW